MLQGDADGSFEEAPRPTRSTRQTPSSSRNNGTANQGDSDDDSDDDPLIQFASQNRPKRSPRGSVIAPMSTEFVDTTSPPHQNGGSLPRTREMIRRKQSTISTSSSTTAIISNQSFHSVTRSTSSVEITSQIEIQRNQVIQ